MPEPIKPIDIVRRYYETFDPNVLADDLEWNVLPTWPAGGRYVGPRGVDAFFAQIFARFADYSARFDDIWETGGNVVITRGFYRVRVTAEAEPCEVRFVHVWTVENGRITRLDQVADSAALLAAVSATRGEATPVSPH